MLFRCIAACLFFAPFSQARGDGTSVLLVVEDRAKLISVPELRIAVSNALQTDVVGPGDSRATAAARSVWVFIDTERNVSALCSGPGRKSVSRAIHLPLDAREAQVTLALLVERLAGAPLEEFGQTRAVPIEPSPPAKRWALQAGASGGFHLGAVEAIRNHEYGSLRLNVQRRWTRFSASAGVEYGYTYIRLSGIAGASNLPDHSVTAGGEARIHFDFRHVGLEMGLGLGAIYFTHAPVPNDGSGFGFDTESGLAGRARFNPAIAFKGSSVEVVVGPELIWATSTRLQVGIALDFRWWLQ